MEKTLAEIREQWREYPKLAACPKCPICGVPTILDLAKGNQNQRSRDKVYRLIKPD